MIVLIIQTLLLVAIAYILGCMLGSLAYRLFNGGEIVEAEPAPKIVAKEQPKPAPVQKVAETKPSPAPAKPTPAPVAAKPAPKKVAAAPVRKSSAKDDLKRIRGIGPQNEARLNAIDVMTFADIAAWSAKDQRDIGERLAFPGRIEREEWVSQAKVLAKGGETDFAKRVDKGEVSSSVGKASTSTGSKPDTLVDKPSSGIDDLTKIDGIGSALESKLNAIGIYNFGQIAKWTKANEAWVGNELGFPGRSERENWVSEAKALSKGGAGTSAKSTRGQIKAKRK